jgi:hypothetical protein
MDVATKDRAAERLSNPKAYAIRAFAIGDEPIDESYDQDGVDRSLIRWMLGLTPGERLAQVQGTIDLVRSVSLPRLGGHPARDYSRRSSANAAEKITSRFIQERCCPPRDGARLEDGR